MVNFCAVVGCGNRSNRDKEKRFYRLPAVITNQGAQARELSEKRRLSWLAAIRRKDIKVASYVYIRVCSDHFLSGRPSTLYDTTSPDWIPSLKLGHGDTRQSDTSRHDRASSRAAKRRRLQEQAAKDEEDKDVIEEENVQKEAAQNSSDEVQQLKQELEKTKKEVAMVSAELARTCEELKTTRLDEAGFRGNNEKVLYYTGLPTWDLLHVVFTFLKDHLSSSSRRALSPFQQLVMTLMRLRLNLSGQDLAYRFGVHQSTVSRTFSQVINVMYVRLKPIIIWPERDALRRTMPMDFRKHCPNCAVIIDCFEIFVERPSNLLARAQTYSSYKHHNTAKYLIGITPQGTVCFISGGWGGRVSDKHLTENSGLLNNLIPGDTVLADRGFDISDSVGLYCARVTTPTSTKGKKQLTGIEVEQTRHIANVRIHVERVIGITRQKYTFLSGTQPVDFLIPREDGVPLLDKVVFVCCALINVCDSVVPFD